MLILIILLFLVISIFFLKMYNICKSKNSITQTIDPISTVAYKKDIKSPIKRIKPEFSVIQTDNVQIPIKKIEPKYEVIQSPIKKIEPRPTVPYSDTIQTPLNEIHPRSTADNIEPVKVIKPQKINHELVKMTYYIIDKFDLEINPRNLYKFLEMNKTGDLNNVMYNIFMGFDEVPIIKKLQIGDFVVWKTMNQNHISNIYEEIVRISKDPSVDDKTKANCIDVLRRSNNKKYIDISDFLLSKLRTKENNEIRYNNVNQIRNQVQKLEGKLTFNPFITEDENIEMQEVLFNQIRALRAQEFNLHENENRKQTVYMDSQNVHNHEINNKVMDAASAIVNSGNEQNVGTNLNMPIEDEMKRVYPNYEKHKSAIEASLRRIETDPAKFKDGMTIKVIFDKIVNFIFRNKHKDELLKRLAEELVDMNGLCSTGHVSRLINTLQGFPDLPEELTIKINPKDEIYANIQTYLNNVIQNDPDSEKMMDDMLSDNSIDNQRYFKFVKDKMLDKSKELEKDYNGIVDKELLYLNIEDSLNTYLKNPKAVLYIMSEIK